MQSESTNSSSLRSTAGDYLAIARRFGHDIDKDMYLTLEDVIDNLGKNFLGLTLGCARCHEHKYDPVSADDYYALDGIFQSTKFAFPGCEPEGQPRDMVPLVSPQEVAALMKPWKEKVTQAETLTSTLLMACDDKARARQAYRTLFQREPSQAELERVRRFHETYPGDAMEKWSALSRILLAGNEFLFVESLTMNSRISPAARSRRSFLRSAVVGSLLFPGIVQQLIAEAGDPLAPRDPHFPAQAKNVIFLFVPGGVSHVDTFDPEPELIR
jgi:hypothetical protein